MDTTETLSAQHRDAAPPEPVETAKEDSWLKRTVRLSGLSFLVGDMAIIGRSLSRAFGPGGNKAELGNAATGAVWASAGVLSGLFGNPKKPVQLRIHAHNLEQYLLRQGVDIPTDVKEQSELLRDKGMYERVTRFISKHPTEVFNSIIGTAAVGMIYSGTHATTKEGRQSLWAGLMVMAGALCGVLIKEDPNAREKTKDGNFLDKAIAFIREKPLRLTSAFYLANNYFTGAQAWHGFDDYRKGKGDYRFIFPTVATGANVVGNSLLAMSDRNQLKEGYSADQVGQFEDIAAHLIVHRKDVSRDAIVDTVARYMNTQSISERPIEQLRREIDDRADRLTSRENMTHEERLASQENSELGAVRSSA